jgi:hypothetical protein
VYTVAINVLEPGTFDPESQYFIPIFHKISWFCEQPGRKEGMTHQMRGWNSGPIGHDFNSVVIWCFDHHNVLQCNHNIIQMIISKLLKYCKSTKPCEDKLVMMIMVFQKMKCQLLCVLCLLQRQDKIPRVRCLLITPKRKDQGRSLLFTSGECNKHHQLLPEKINWEGETKTAKPLSLSS